MTNPILSLSDNSWIYLENGGIKNGKIQKIPYGTSKTWTKEEALSKMNYFESQGKTMLGLFQCVRLKNSGIICIDFDDPDAKLEVLYILYPFLKGTLMSPGNNKGFHFYFLSDYKGKTVPSSKLTFLGDILVENVFEKEDKKWTGELKRLSMDDFNTFLKDDEPTTDTESVSSTSSSTLKPITADERQMMDLIPPSCYRDYLPWTMFISACKNSWSDGIQIANHYSSLIDGYEGIEDVEKRASMNQSKGYLVNLVKKHNLQAWKEIQKGKVFTRPKNLTPYELAEFLMDTTDTVVKVHDNLYYYEDNYWNHDTTSDRNHVRRILIGYLRDVLKGLIKKACIDLSEDVENENKKKLLKHLQDTMDKHINNPVAASRIVSEFNTYSLNRDIKFDDKPYLFCFKNCAFDLRTNQIHHIQKEDYITMYADYEWTPSTSDQIQFIDDLFKDILPHDDVRLCKISTLRCGMIGLAFENFIMESGSGGNGKDVISNLYQRALTSTYFYKGNIATLLDMKMKTGANPELANIHKKRFVVFSEPPANSVLNMGTLKDLTGGGTINARQLYKGDCECSLENITSFICNERPTISGDIGDAEMRRFINIPYTQVYSTNETKIQKGAKRANLLYKTSAFQEDHKIHFINYLLQFSYQEPYIPKCIREETERYLFDSDNTSSYFADKVVFTEDETDYISLADLTALFKEQFTTGSKEFRGMNSKKLLDILKRNVVWKDKVSECFCEGRCRKKDKNGKQMNVSNVFLKMKLSNQEEELENI